MATHDGTDLFEQVIKADGFTAAEEGGVTTLTSVSTGDVFTARRTEKGRYMILKVGSAEKPLSFGAQLGNGNLGTNIRAKLANWGIETRPQRLQLAAKQARQEAAAAVTPVTATPNDVAPPTPQATIPAKDDMTAAADEILADIPTSIELIRARVLDLAKADENPQRIEERGVVCYDWTGDLYTALRYLWPTLPEEPDPEDLTRLYMELHNPMRLSGVLRQVKEQDRPPFWRVRDDEAPKPAAPVPAPTKEAAMSPMVAAVPVPPEPVSVTPASVATPEENDQEVKIYHCEVCTFADAAQSAVQGHVNKFKARPDEHPRDTPSLLCPEKGCPSVRTEPYQLRKHCVEVHPEKYEGKVLCTKCLYWSDNIGEYREHLKTEHPDALRRPRPEPEPEPAVVAEPAPVVALKPAKRKTAAVTAPTAAPVPVAAAVTPAPAAKVVATVNGSAPAVPAAETPAEAAVRMLTEYPGLVRENAELREQADRDNKRIMDLQMQVRERDRTLKAFRRKLNSLFDDGGADE